MRSLAFNSVENEFCENIGGPDDLVKWRVDIKKIIQNTEGKILFIQRSTL